MKQGLFIAGSMVALMAAMPVQAQEAAAVETAGEIVAAQKRVQNVQDVPISIAVVTIAILATDIMFAIDSVPAVYGITGDPYLVFVTNAFALLGLRALYFVLQGVLAKLVHLSYGLAIILAFIGVKLVLHWAHGVWAWVPTVPTLASCCKMLASETLGRVADRAVQIHGGTGFAVEQPVSRVLADARILNIFEGAGEIQAQVIARRLLEGAN